MTEGLSRTVLAISAFRSDDSVLRLLGTAFSGGTSPFGAVIVVDSLGTGRIADEAARRGWPVHVENADHNLGSAGNLARRLELAAATGLDWCLTLNHDASLDVGKAEALVACGRQGTRVGAVYPQLRLTSIDRFDRPRRRFTLFGMTNTEPLPPGPPVDVAWASSNGALYNLEAVGSLGDLWPALWMGYEDLAIGWELQRAGWKQWLCPAVTVDDDYEMRSVGAASLADKPAWYAYYQARNPMLIARRSGWRAIGRRALALRYVSDIALTLLLRPQKARRLSLWWNGLRDGWAGRDGHGPVP